MVIQLTLVFALFTVHLRHLLQAIKHALHDTVVRHIDATSDLKAIYTNELALNPRDVYWEVFDEMRYASSFLRVKSCLFDSLDLLILPCTSAIVDYNENDAYELTTCRSKMTRRR